MWVMISRTRRPDASIWPGRKELAAIDAVVWPLAWAAVVRHVPAPIGLVGPVAYAFFALSAIRRLYRALCLNQRYWFATWRWGKIAAAMLLMGWVLKLTMKA